MATTAADLAAGQIAMVAAARFTYEHKAVCTNIFSRMTLDAGEKSKYVPKFGTAVAADLTDGIDLTAENFLTITGNTHTTDEAGLKIIVTKKLRQQMKADAYAAAGKVIGNAMGKKIDQDGLALFSGLDSGFTAAATVLTLGYQAAAVSQCQGQAEPVPDLVAVYHPHQINAFVDQLSVSANGQNFPTAFAEDMLRNYWRGNEKIYSTPIFVAGNIQNNTSGTTTGANGAVFSREAFVYLVGWEPTTWVDEDPSGRMAEIGIVADYAMVEEQGTYGRFMNFDNAAPTS